MRLVPSAIAALVLLGASLGAWPLPDSNLAQTGLFQVPLSSSAGAMVSFTAGSTFRASRITLMLSSAGAPRFPLRASLRGGASGPSCVSSTAAEYRAYPQDVDSVPTLVTLSCFRNCSPSPLLVQGYTYWLVVWDTQDDLADNYSLGANDQPYASYMSTGSVCAIGTPVPGGLIFAPYSLVGTPTFTATGSYTQPPTRSADPHPRRQTTAPP